MQCLTARTHIRKVAECTHIEVNDKTVNTLYKNTSKYARTEY